VDGDFQTRYVAAEKAYGAGYFEAARTITSALLAELEPVPESTEERNAVLAWRAFVALLAGHIHLYGLQQPDQARAFYSLVLSSHPPDTLQQLAEQGLERLAEQTPAQTGQRAQPEPSEALLISDPFLAASGGVAAAQVQQAQTTATPWLDPTPELVNQQDPIVENDKQPNATALNADEPVNESTTVFVEEAVDDEKTGAEEPIPDSDGANPEPCNSPPVPEGLLQKLVAGRLRVDL